MHRCSIGAAFEVCLAERPAAGGPAFLAPIRRETEAHDHCLDPRISQHCLAHRLTAIKVNEVVLLRYRTESVDVGVQAVYVLPGDEIADGFARSLVCER